MRYLVNSLAAIVMLVGTAFLGVAQDENSPTPRKRWPKVVEGVEPREFKVSEIEKYYPEEWGGGVRARYTEKTLPGTQQSVAHGLAESFHRNGQLLAQSWYHTGLKHGPTRSWDESGTLVYEATFIEGLPHGVIKTWTNDGLPSSETQFFAGLKYGTAKTWWNTTHKLKSETDWIKGMRGGHHKAYYPDGTKKEEGVYNTDRESDWKVGLWTYWHENGQKESKGEYGGRFRKGEKVGEWKYWNEEGELIRTENHGPDEKGED